MPLKYMFNIPDSTYLTGLAHSVLFVAYCVLALLWANKLKWSFGQIILALAASLQTIAPFLVKRKLLKYAE